MALPWWVGGLRQAVLLGSISAYLTYSFVGWNWGPKDFGFVAVIVLSTLYQRFSVCQYNSLMLDHEAKKYQTAGELDQVTAFVQGPEIQLQRNVVTCLLFFGTWDKKSRAWLKEFERLHRIFKFQQDVQFLALTQESQEELDMYHVKGVNASDFCKLSDFGFSIGIEDGRVCKKYLVRFRIESIPYFFVVGKDKSLFWHGDVFQAEKEVREAAVLSLDDIMLDDGASAKQPSKTTSSSVAKKTQ